MAMSFQHDPALPYRWNNDSVLAAADDSKLRLRGVSLFYAAVLFSVVLLVALIFLYGRRICTFGPPAGPTSPSDAAQAPVLSPPLGGLDLAIINSFPIVVYKSLPPNSAAAEAAGCCICLGVYTDGAKLKLLPQCRHRFHPECVNKWLASQSSCPLCRASLRADSPG